MCHAITPPLCGVYGAGSASCEWFTTSNVHTVTGIRWIRKKNDPIHSVNWIIFLKKDGSCVTNSHCELDHFFQNSHYELHHFMDHVSPTHVSRVYSCFCLTESCLGMYGVATIGRLLIIIGLFAE